MTDNTTDAPPRLISADEVMRRTSFCRSTIFRMTKAKTFPAPIRFSQNHIAWREGDVTAWIEARTE